MEQREYSLSQINYIAKWLIDNYLNKNIWLFNGQMGVGKTTLINEISKQLGVKDTPSSPTYSVVNEYKSENGVIYHLDLFRLKNIPEALDAGIEEILFSGALCFIEWPEIILPLLINDYLEINLSNLEQNRQIQIIEHA